MMKTMMKDITIKLFFLLMILGLSWTSSPHAHGGDEEVLLPPQARVGLPQGDDLQDYFSSLYFRKMAPFFDRQKTNSSCSLATITQLINAIIHLKNPHHPLISQEEILNKVGSQRWRRAVRENGGGVGFISFRKYLKEALAAYGIKRFELNVRQKSQRNLHLLREELKLGEQTSGAGEFIVIYFISKRGLGHYSPLGGYLPERDEVLILDVKDVFYRSSIPDLLRQMVYSDMGYLRLKIE